MLALMSFNTQPPEGGWTYYRDILGFEPVSTHSRLKAAGMQICKSQSKPSVSTHSRLKAAGING